MKFYFVKLLTLVCGIIQTECYFEYIDLRRSLNYAVQDCKGRGLELLTLSTYRQYQDALDYFSNRSNPEILPWLALEKNTTTDNYQWLNGRVLTELKWEEAEPTDHSGADCGVMNVSSGLWYSVLCTANRHYLCVGPESSYSVSSVSVDFYTAAISCQSEGRRLPVAITNLDTDWLNDVITSNTLSNDIWLGLMASGTQHGDYYRWVTGEHLTPPFTWRDVDRYPRVHYHHGNDPKYHTDASNHKYVCQRKSPAMVRSPDRFVLVSNQAVVLGSVRKAMIINILTQCALVCLQDVGCVQFTIDGYLCRTFGESLVITDYNGGHVLWQKKTLYSN